MLGDDAAAYGDLEPAGVARSALASAKAGLPTAARKWLARMEEFNPASITHLEGYVELARRCLISNVDDLLDDVRIRVPDPEEATAPYAAKGEAVRIALVYGPRVAADWVRANLNRAAWSTRGSWGWWPLHALLVCLELRNGRIDEARELLERSWLPDVYRMVLEAHVTCAEGDLDKAVAIADEALLRPELTQTWRLSAVVAKASAQLQQPDTSVEAEASLAAEPWRDHLDVVVLGTNPARDLIIDLMGLGVAELAGLAPQS